MLKACTLQCTYFMCFKYFISKILFHKSYLVKKNICFGIHIINSRKDVPDNLKVKNKITMLKMTRVEV